MALEGTFKDFGLADIFQLVGLQKKTGVLTVRGESGRLVTVSFEKGMVVFADEFQRTENERLGNLLLRNGRLTQEQLATAIEVQKSTAQRLGHVLVEQKFISRQELSQVLQFQVKETVYRLFRWQEGSYHFSPEPVTFDREIYSPLAAESVLMEGVRMIDEWPILEKKIPNFQVVFERVLGGEAARPSSVRATAADMEELVVVDDDEPGASAVPAGVRGAEAIGPRENAILALIDGVRTVQEIIDLGRLGEFETCKILYGLLSLNLVRIRPGAAPAPKAPAVASSRQGSDPGQYAVVAVAAALALVSFLFNPWGIVAQGFRALQGRQESALLIDAVRLRRVRLALEVFYLEKQAYPPSLEALVESGLLRRRELRGVAGAGFLYRGGEREYRLEREAGQ